MQSRVPSRRSSPSTGGGGTSQGQTPVSKPRSHPSTPATYQIKIDVTYNEHLPPDGVDQLKWGLKNLVNGYSPSNDAKISIVRQTGGSDKAFASFPADMDIDESGSSNKTLISSSVSSLPPPQAAHSGTPVLALQPQGDGSSKRLQKQSKPHRILFYHAHDPYYGFTNFSPHPVEYQGKIYPTSEHLFQSLKFLPHRPELAEHMRTCSDRPRAVFDEAHRFNPEVRPDWLTIRIEMASASHILYIEWPSLTSHHRCSSCPPTDGDGDAELVEDSDKDAFWGVGPDGNGENQLGKALQRLRQTLRDMGAGQAKPALTKSHR
ncbi:hypothetical protein ID866_8125 [Astraeus odoratus]|nr:hypothetical protein ID866_8125 [Astraeus odoratus]